MYINAYIPLVPLQLMRVLSPHKFIFFIESKGLLLCSFEIVKQEKRSLNMRSLHYNAHVQNNTVDSCMSQ